MSKPKISNAVIRRLPRYLRYLAQFREQGIKKISSGNFSKLTGCSASQIRQDFNAFGEFGQQGYGYNIEYLYNEISSILGLNNVYKTIVVGVGNLGQAIIKYTYYNQIGFNIVGLFDSNPKIIGNWINDVEIMDSAKLVDFVKKQEIDIGVICVPSENAQDVADELVEGGVRGIWNFAPLDLEVPDNVAIESVQLSYSLQYLSFLLNNPQELGK